jgi:hypothetical protein
LGELYIPNKDEEAKAAIYFPAAIFIYEKRLSVNDKQLKDVKSKLGAMKVLME